jgi:hypothetical protein
MDNKPTQRTLGISTEKLSKLSSFQGLGKLLFIYKKTEKLITALYLVTNFIKDIEPIRSKIRNQGVNLLSLHMSFMNASLTDRSSAMKAYEMQIIEILSLCDIARHSALISEMNFSILKREFESVLDMMVIEYKNLFNEDTSTLPSAFFDIAPVPMNLEQKKDLHTKKFGNTEISQKTSSSIGETGDKEKKMYVAVVEKKNSRRESILSILMKGQGLGVKDFSAVIPDCSEKTIQRELIDMVKEGVLRKEGERRWSRYYTV